MYYGWGKRIRPQLVSEIIRLVAQTFGPLLGRPQIRIVSQSRRAPLLETL